MIQDAVCESGVMWPDFPEVAANDFLGSVNYSLYSPPVVTRDPAYHNTQPVGEDAEEQ